MSVPNINYRFLDASERQCRQSVSIDTPKKKYFFCHPAISRFLPSFSHTHHEGVHAHIWQILCAARWRKLFFVIFLFFALISSSYIHFPLFAPFLERSLKASTYSSTLPRPSSTTSHSKSSTTIRAHHKRIPALIESCMH